jgi:thiamine-phosphate pyrophosphorylase
MAPQLYLITPATVDAETFPARLMAMLSAAPFAALLIQRGTMDDASYARLAAGIVHIGQGGGCAVLVEDDVALAKRVGADGVHVTGGQAALREALLALKPEMIVGAGNLSTRHDAMSAGEMEVDYVFFGPLAGEADPEAHELAQWWAETFEIPAVLSNPGANAANIEAHDVEFLALSSSVWTGGPEQARAIAAAMGETA